MSIIVAIPSSVELVSRKEFRTLSPSGTGSVSAYVGGCGQKSAICPDLISNIKIGISLLSVIDRDVESCWLGNVSFCNTRGQKTVLSVTDLDRRWGAGETSRSVTGRSGMGILLLQIETKARPGLTVVIERGKSPA